MIFTPDFPSLSEGPEDERTRVQKAADLLDRLGGAIRLQSPSQETLVREILALIDEQQAMEDGELRIEWNLWGRLFRVRGTIPGRESVKVASLVAFVGSAVNDLLRAIDQYAQAMKPG